MTHVPWHPDDIEGGEEIEGFESVELISVGIDIGTTTTHFLISRLLARRQGGNYSSKFKIVEREIVYRSPIRLTPYEDEDTIDADRIDEFLKASYEDAGYTPDDVDTGTVITTGEASRKKNAEAIIELFSEESGKFVCATAGPNLETLMSAHGSGAAQYSLDTDQDVLHIDIGGGTAKIACIVDGVVESTASINVGARLISFDEEGRLANVEDAARQVLDELEIDATAGEPLGQAEQEALAERFAELLFEVVDDEPSALANSLMVTDELEMHPFDVITFAGGGAEYIYDRDAGFYDDLGPLFGKAIRERVERDGYDVAELDVGIRATAIGSTQHTVQVSGNTITISDHSLLPMRNVPMVPFVVDEDDQTNAVTAEVLEKLDMYDVDKLDEPFAFGYHLHGSPSSEFLRTVLTASIEGWQWANGQSRPLIMAFESDVAKSIGHLATSEIDQPVIAVDGVDLAQFGYIDIGESVEYTGAVPITVKSLVFEG